MALEVKCRACGKLVEEDEGLTCRACRLMIKTPFRMKIPSFSEMRIPETKSGSAGRKSVWVYAAVTALLPILMTVAYWAAKHFFP